MSKFLFANDAQGHYPNSWYAATTEVLAQQDRLQGGVEADVCIIGAGFTGLSAALHLSQRGYKVALLDAHRVGFGASGRNGGQVGSGLNHSQMDLEKSMGIDAAKTLWSMTQAAKSLVRDLIETHAPEAHYTAGIAHADFHASDTKHSHAEAEHLRKTYGYDQIEPLDQSAMRDLIGSRKYTGGTIDWGAGHIHPLRYCIGLARAALKFGAQIYENSCVTKVDAGHVFTDQGHVKAKWIIHATNGYHTGLNPAQNKRVMPINNYLVATEPLGDLMSDVLSKPIAVADNRFVLNYYRPSHDGRLIFGGGESYGTRFPKDIFAKTRKPMLEIFPHLQDVKLTHAWGGTLGITPTRLPLFARQGFELTAAGYSGHGVALATLAGQIMADLIAGQSERFDILSKLKPPAFPGGQLLRSPIMTLAMTWFSMRDRLGL